MNNKYLKQFINIILVIIIAYGFGFLYNNYRLIHNSNETNIIYLDNNSFELNNFKVYGNQLVSIGENPTLKIRYENAKYIDKILFDYNIENNIDFDLQYVYKNVYGRNEEKKYVGFTNKHINVFSEKIGESVYELTLVFKTSDKIILNNFRINNIISFFNLSYFYFIFVFIAIYLLVFYRKYIKDHIEYLFLLLCLSSGLIIILNHQIDIQKSWDDQIHFSSIYGISNAYYSQAAYDYADEELNFNKNNFKYFNTEEEINQLKNYLNKSDNIDTNYKTNFSFTLNKVVYIPHMIIFAICDLLNVPFTFSFLLGLFINLILYVLVMFFAIRKTPKYKYLMLVIGLIPTSVFMATSYSYDPPITAFILLGMAYYLSVIDSKDKINKKDLVAMISSFAIACTPKAIYFPIMLLLLTLPKEKFTDKKKYNVFRAVVIGITLLLVATFFIPVATNTMQSDVRGGATSVGGQIKTILRSPVSFAKVFFENAGIQFFYKLFSVTTLFNFAYFGELSKVNCYYLFLFLLFISVFINKNNKNVFDKKSYILNVLICLLTICFIWGSMYLLFTPVASVEIGGVQNRYFIPLLFNILLLLGTSKVKIDYSEEKIYYLYAIILTITTFVPVYYYFI